MTSRIALSLAAVICLSLALSTTVPAAEQSLISTWKAPDAPPLDFAGKKVAALVIVDDEHLRVSAETELARQITARGPVGVAAHLMIPREELTDKDRAKGWFERGGVEGLVILRVVGTETQKVYSSYVWSSGYYAYAWDYYRYGWSTVTPIGKGRNETTITVETLLYDLKTGKPLWAGVSRATDPKDVASFIKKLAKDVGSSLEKQGLARKAAR